MIVLRLPFPVSVNHLYRNKLKGRAKSQRYRTWANAAGWDIKDQKPKPLKGWYNLSIILTEKDNRRKDPGNFEKCVSDLLVEHGLVEDDSFCVSLSITRQKGMDNYCDVIVTPSNGIPVQQELRRIA